jgi:hypothetical protein
MHRNVELVDDETDDARDGSLTSSEIWTKPAGSTTCVRAIGLVVMVGGGDGVKEVEVSDSSEGEECVDASLEEADMFCRPARVGISGIGRVGGDKHGGKSNSTGGSGGGEARVGDGANTPNCASRTIGFEGRWIEYSTQYAFREGSRRAW